MTIPFAFCIAALITGHLDDSWLRAVRRDANALTPVFLAHGRQDNVVPLSRGTASRDLLLAQGQPLAWHDYPMQHAVCLEEIQALQQWLLGVLDAG